MKWEDMSGCWFTLSPPPTSAWVIGMLDEVGGHVWILIHTVPPPTSAWVMGMWDEVGGHVWMLVHTVPHLLQLVQEVCR